MHLWMSVSGTREGSYRAPWFDLIAFSQGPHQCGSYLAIGGCVGYVVTLFKCMLMELYFNAHARGTACQCVCPWDCVSFCMPVGLRVNVHAGVVCVTAEQ